MTTTHKRFVLVEEDWFKKREPNYRTSDTVGDTRISQLQDTIQTERSKPANQLSAQKINQSVQEIMKIKSTPKAIAPPPQKKIVKKDDSQSTIEKSLSQYSVSDRQMTDALRALKHLDDVSDLKNYDLRDSLLEVLLAITSPGTNTGEHLKLRDYRSVWQYLHKAGFQSTYISNPAVRKSYEKHMKTPANKWLE